jgi:hypothetical protein
MLKCFLSILQVKFVGIIESVDRRSFFPEKEKKWYVYAAQAIFLVVLPVCVEAGEPFPFQVVVPEYDHGLFVSPKVVIEDIPVTERLSFQDMNSIIESRSESIGGDIESTPSKNVQRDPRRSDDGQECKQGFNNESKINNGDVYDYLLLITFIFLFISSITISLLVIYGKL